MRHRVEGNQLGRDPEHLKSLLRNMSDSLVLNQKIVTTLAKAKSLRPYIEKILTRAKKSNDFNTVKYVKNRLTTKEGVKKLISEIAPKYKDRKGGYTRITKLPSRVGDNAKMAKIELI